MWYRTITIPIHLYHMYIRMGCVVMRIKYHRIYLYSILYCHNLLWPSVVVIFVVKVISIRFLDKGEHFLILWIRIIIIFNNITIHFWHALVIEIRLQVYIITISVCPIVLSRLATIVNDILTNKSFLLFIMYHEKHNNIKSMHYEVMSMLKKTTLNKRSTIRIRHSYGTCIKRKWSTSFL